LKKIVASAWLALAALGGAARAGPVPGKDAAAPPLPFAYLGKWTQDGHTTVFLSRDQSSYAAHVGENLDSDYRVDAIEENRILLTYLPLGIQRVLSFSATSTEALALTINAPQQIAAEQEFPVSLAVLAAPGQNASATVVLTYDASLLNAVDGDGSPGRMSVRIVAAASGREAKPTVLRFQAVGGAPAVTTIEISAQAVDANGRALDIRAPASYQLRIVP